jgi:hypothetical protein
MIEVEPLAPKDWAYFALDDLPYHGSKVSIIWDKDGSRYNRGAGLQILVNGQKVASSPTMGKLQAKVPSPEKKAKAPLRVNYAVNNDGTYYPLLTASYSAQNAPLAAVNDGNSWYHIHPPNRWTTAGSPNATDWLVVDLGMPRKVDAIHLNFLDDGEKVVPPAKYDVEYWTGQEWRALSGQKRQPEQPTGRRGNVVSFSPTDISKVRVTFTHAPAGKAGLSEVEIWGTLSGEYQVAPPPPGNLALNMKSEGFPKATASANDAFGGVPRLANDGRTSYRSTPMNRWTTYGSKNKSDWLEIDFGASKEFNKLELCIYDDRGGVQPPAEYNVQVWDGTDWKNVPDQKKSPEQPAGSTINTVRFPTQNTSKVRVVFTHKGDSRSGLTEILAWKE